MVKIIDVGQTMRAPGLYRVAKDYVIKERVNVNPYNCTAIYWHGIGLLMSSPL